MSSASQTIQEIQASALDTVLLLTSNHNIIMDFMFHENDIDERYKCLRGMGQIIDGEWVNDVDEDETDGYETDEDDYVEYDENKNNEIVEDTDDVDKKEDEQEICPSCGDEVIYTLT